MGNSGLANRTELLDGLDLPAPYAARIASLRRLMDDLDIEIDLFAGIIRGRMAKEPGYTAVQKIPGIGPTLVPPPAGRAAFNLSGTASPRGARG